MSGSQGSSADWGLFQAEFSVISGHISRVLAKSDHETLQQQQNHAKQDRRPQHGGILCRQTTGPPFINLQASM